MALPLETNPGASEQARGEMTNALTLVLAFTVSLILALFFLPRLEHIAMRIGLMDHPQERKMHTTPKPVVGGLGMALAFFLSCLFFVPLSNLRGYYAGLVLLVIVGFLDDFRELNHGWKFIAQILAAALIIFLSKTMLLSFGDLFSFGAVNLGMFSVPLTIFCCVGVINAVNMIDGLDGLAGGLSLIAFVSFALLSALNKQTELLLLNIALIGVVAGFLRYNVSPSRLFMGDAGSLFLGFSLAFFSVAITQKEKSLVSPVVPLLILAVPIVDTVTVMLKRMMKGKNPFHADKTHIHHVLMRKGFSRNGAVFIILLIAFVFSLTGVWGVFLGVPDYYLFLVFLFYLVFNIVWFRFHPIRLSPRNISPQHGGCGRRIEDVSGSSGQNASR